MHGGAGKNRFRWLVFLWCRNVDMIPDLSTLDKNGLPFTM